MQSRCCICCCGGSSIGAIITQEKPRTTTVRGFLFRSLRGEVLNKEAMDTDVSAADLAEEDALGAIVEEADVV